MKTREQAEQRAFELFPIGDFPFREDVENQLILRETFLQCWDEMQEYNQKELLCEMMRKDEEGGVYNDIISHALRKGSKGVIMPKCVRLGELNKKNQLREAAENGSIEKLKNDYLRGEYELDEFVERLKEALK